MTLDTHCFQFAEYSLLSDESKALCFNLHKLCDDKLHSIIILLISIRENPSVNIANVFLL